MLVSTPKARVVKLKISPAGQESFSVGGSGAKATHYIVKIDIGGIEGVAAKVVGKQPPPGLPGSPPEVHPSFHEIGRPALRRRTDLANRAGEPSLAEDLAEAIGSHSALCAHSAAAGSSLSTCPWTLRRDNAGEADEPQAIVTVLYDVANEERGEDSAALSQCVAPVEEEKSHSYAASSSKLYS